MESNNKTVQHEHLSYEEIKHFYDLEPGYLSSSDSRLTQKIHESLDSCSICRQRFQFYVDTDAAFPGFSDDENALNEKAVRYFQGFLSKADQALHEKLNSWLEGSRNFINDLGQMTLQPALAGATRGLGDTENVVDLEVPVVGDDGFFMFELQQEAKLNFSIKKETVDGQPVCLAVFGQDGTDFSAVYPLTALGKDYLLAETTAALPAGEYALCVPTIRADE